MSEPLENLFEIKNARVISNIPVSPAEWRTLIAEVRLTRPQSILQGLLIGVLGNYTPGTVRDYFFVRVYDFTFLPIEPDEASFVYGEYWLNGESGVHKVQVGIPSIIPYGVFDCLFMLFELVVPPGTFINPDTGWMESGLRPTMIQSVITAAIILNAISK